MTIPMIQFPSPPRQESLLERILALGASTYITNRINEPFKKAAEQRAMTDAMTLASYNTNEQIRGAREIDEMNRQAEAEQMLRTHTLLTPDLEQQLVAQNVPVNKVQIYGRPETEYYIPNAALGSAGQVSEDIYSMLAPISQAAGVPLPRTAAELSHAELGVAANALGYGLEAGRLAQGNRALAQEDDLMLPRMIQSISSDAAQLAMSNLGWRDKDGNVHPLTYDRAVAYLAAPFARVRQSEPGSAELLAQAEEVVGIQQLPYVDRKMVDERMGQYLPGGDALARQYMGESLSNLGLGWVWNENKGRADVLNANNMTALLEQTPQAFIEAFSWFESFGHDIGTLRNNLQTARGQNPQEQAVLGYLQRMFYHKALLEAGWQPNQPIGDIRVNPEKWDLGVEDPPQYQMMQQEAQPRVPPLGPRREASAVDGQTVIPTNADELINTSPTFGENTYDVFGKSVGERANEIAQLRDAGRVADALNMFIIAGGFNYGYQTPEGQDEASDPVWLMLAWRERLRRAEAVGDQATIRRGRAYLNSLLHQYDNDRQVRRRESYRVYQ